MPLFSGRAAHERRLRDTSRQLARAREELAILDEQSSAVADVYDDTSLDASVSDDRLARHEASEAKKHLESTARRRGELVASIADLEAKLDQLIDRLPADRR